MTEPKWYERGMIGEVVLMNMEHYLLGSGEPDYQGFTMWAAEFGLKSDEILDVINEANVAKSLGEVT